MAEQEESSNLLPLRWESTGDQWWYASPIDIAAANGSYPLVRHLLHIDPNLLIKLTSLRRIRRLESVWDDKSVARNRSIVAQSLFRECDEEDQISKSKSNSLIRAGYGGWLIYTASAAGDVAFVTEILTRDAFLVFGEGEYGVTDLLYAAARSGVGEVFRLLVNCAISQKGASVSDEESGKRFGKFPETVLKNELMNRAAHAAARGGFVEMLREILKDGSDSEVLGFRDWQGCGLLHSAAAKGRVEVVEVLLGSYGMDPTAKDNQGNTALHVAAYRGHLAVLKVLLASLSVGCLTNNNGDTFLHMAVAGFRTPGFHRIDKQLELMKQLLSDGVVDNLREIINVQNNVGRTALHVAVAENIPCELVELLMAVPSIALNSRDHNGMTPLDLLRKRARSAGSEVLIKRLVSAGGRASFIDDRAVKSALVSDLKLQGIGNSPGTSFRIPDAEILLYTKDENGSSDAGYGFEIAEYNLRLSAVSHINSAFETCSPGPEKKPSSGSKATRRLKMLLQWAIKKEKGNDIKKLGCEESPEFYKVHGTYVHNHVPLRQRFSKSSSLSIPSIKKTFPMDNTLLPSPSTKKKFAAGLLQGVIPQEPLLTKSSTSSVSRSSSMTSEENHEMVLSVCNKSILDKPTRLSQKGSLNIKLMNQYFCFGTHVLAVENTICGRKPTENHRRAVSLAN